MFPEFNFLDRTIGTYGLLCMIGLIVSAVVVYRLGKEYKISFEDIILLMLSIGVGILIGGHTLYGITNIEKILKTLSLIGKISYIEIFKQLSICFGGSVFYGGFIGAIIAILIHTRISKTLNRNQILDIFAVSAPLFHFFGRIGCALGGCCYGIESKFGYTVFDNQYIPELNGVNRFPVQFLEAILNIIIFVFILYLHKKSYAKENLIYCYIISYSIIRFLVEFLRGDLIRGIWFGLSTSQWISILLFIIGTTMLIYKKQKKAKGCI